MPPERVSPNSSEAHWLHQWSAKRPHPHATPGAGESEPSGGDPRSNRIGDDLDRTDVFIRVRRVMSREVTTNDMSGNEEHNGPYEQH